MPILTVHTLAVIFGILGNAVSVGVFLAPVPTFYRIYKKKSSEGYQSIPYVVSLFSALLLLYYGSLKTDGILLITINSFGIAVELLYLMIYVVYAPKKAKNLTLQLLLVGDLGGCSLVMVLTTFLARGSTRVAIVGWINAVINFSVFAAPLGVMRQVIRTKSVEFMPISLSLALCLNATMWFFYGFFIKDNFIAVPNVLGFILGMAQVVLYFIYKRSSSKVEKDSSQHEPSNDSKLDSENIGSNKNQQTELKVIVGDTVVN